MAERSRPKYADEAIVATGPFNVERDGAGLGEEAPRMDIGAWLRGLDLERYADAFRENDIDSEVLPDLTADDLTAMGVTSVGHRRKLLAAITVLKTGPAQS